MAAEHKIGRTSDSGQHGNGQQRELGKDRETFECWVTRLRQIRILGARRARADLAPLMPASCGRRGLADTACPNISFSLFPGWKFDLMACLLHGPKNNVTWIETTVIFNLCDYGQKLADFSLFCSTPTKKSCKIARNCHFALHHHAIDFPFLNRKY
jgi:hypothetical protein